jgi:microcystin-dependent protein
MGTPYIGEIRMVGFTFAPVGWALCNGALIPISENDALFSLIGTTYGGDGQSTFALPNLCSRIPLHMDTNAATGETIPIGQTGGTETVTLTLTQIPAHTHVPAAAITGSANSPASAVWGGWTGAQFIDQPAATPMNPAALGSSGGNQPHENLPPFLTINFIISLFGIYPTQN